MANQQAENSRRAAPAESAASASTLVTSKVDIHDRVADAYYGKLGAKFMRKTQERIHWICAQVDGHSVLDVGCSQGITSILLGREGKQVLAIDSDARSIEEANTLLDAETDRVKKHVVFVNTDFLNLPAPASQFDTVILSEVLEHLLQPSVFVEAATRCLKPRGVMVVTVPFGINDFIDHKRTYYLSEPYQLLSRHLEITNVTVLGRWLGLAGRKRPAGPVAPSGRGLSNELIDQLEAAFYKLECELRQEAADARHKLAEANLRYREVTEQVTTCRTRLAQEEQSRMQAQSDLTALRALQDQAGNTAQLLQTQRNELTFQVQSLQGSLIEKDKDLARLNREFAAVSAQNGLWQATWNADLQRTQAELDAARALHRETELDLVKAQTERDLFANQLRSQEDLLKQEREVGQDARIRVIQLDEHSKFLSRQAETAQAEKDALEQRLGMEHEHLTSRLEQLRVQLQQSTSEREDLRQQLAALRAELTRQTEAARQESAERSAALLARTAAERAAIDGALQAAQARCAELQAELATQRETLLKLTSERDTEQALRRSVAHQAEQVKRQLLQAQRAREDLRGQLERAQQEKLTAEDRVARTRAMVSFRLGYTLLHGFGSLGAAMKLPAQLWRLRREGQRRHLRKQAQARALDRVHTPRSTPAVALFPPSATVTSWLHLPDRPPAEALKGLKVACIMDEFTFSSYAPECNLLPLSVDHWQQELETFVPELLFIESAWRGKDDRWGSKVGHLSSEVTDILAWCRARQIPTVFWNKEDPIHFETFLTTARLFDHVFTTDIDCIHRYKGALGHDRVHLLPFACQPAASNPIETCERKDAFCFAGAYYVRYPERTRDLGNFMVHLAEHRPVEIYDRNFGKNDPNYQFPAEYQPFIVGTLPFDQIDKAYKGYRYAINLNSIKQSQSMFARRVFELLASNTITISNYSRGVRLLFGDLVVTTDSGQDIVRRLQKLCGDPVNERKFRLAGLRKVMRDHTYQDRLACVVAKVRGTQGNAQSGLLPCVTMTGHAKNQQQLDALMASFERQTHTERRLLVVTPNDFVPSAALKDSRVQLLTTREVEDRTLGDLAATSPWVAGIVPDDYHGPNYLLDLVLATRYSQATVIGKATHAVWSTQDGMSLACPDAQYRPAMRLPARCALLNVAQNPATPLREWVTSLYTRQLDMPDMLAVDEFNYCKNGAQAPDVPKVVNDLDGLDGGMDMAELMARAEAVEAEPMTEDTDPVLTGAELAAHFKPAQGKAYRLDVAGAGWEVSSQLGDGKHEYVYAATDLTPEALGAGQHIRFHLDCTPGLNLQLAVLFLDAHKQRISHVVKPANRNHEAAVPAGTAWVRLGLRLYGSGDTRINGLVLGHRPLRPATVLGRAEHLLLTNHYPSYDDLYRNGFVHSRVTAYRERGMSVDVFRLRKDEGMSYHEYQNVDVMTGAQDALHKLLGTGRYKSVLVHFLDPAMWEVLKLHIDRIKVIVWVHGAEIQPWHRRDHNCDNDEERAAAKARSDVRMAFWRGLLRPPPPRLKLVFVSRYFAEEVMEDLGFRLPEAAYSIIHNPIDTELFSYQPKPAEQRRKVLSIRPYSSRTYANDLSVAAVLQLSRRPCFAEMSFRFIGDGKLFDATLEPLRKFDNVVIERRFLPRAEIAALHKTHGVFLCPSRMDTQGVSRDEAMASGLVAVTNAVAAVPEFVSNDVGRLAAAESVDEIAAALEELCTNPDTFVTLSEAAAHHVRRTSALPSMIDMEASIILDVDEARQQ